MPRKNSKAAPKVTKGKNRSATKSSKTMNTRRARSGAMGRGY